MELKPPVRLIIALFFLQLLTAVTTFANSIPIPYYFITTETSVLRNASLTGPVNIPAGARITIDPAFLLSVFGTVTPTQEQVQRLLLNPGEASRGRVVTERFRNVGSRRYSNDYFFPVNITTADGQSRSGKMALQYYNRTGAMDLRRTDGQDPARFQSADLAEEQRALVERNRQTEADACSGDCSRGGAAPSPTAPIADLARSIDESGSAANPLWTQYQAFAREFTAANRITRSNAPQKRTLFLRTLVSRFGAENAGKMLAAITAFGEAPIRNSDVTQVAESAAILKVIENRASANYRRRSRALRNAGISVTANARLTNVLADWQFSVWNDRDNNLSRMLSFNPDRADNQSKRKMRLAFEAQRLMSTNRITFEGRMNNANLMHYHANYVTPNWASRSRRVTAANVIVNGTRINVSDQRGSRHIFYAGVP